MRIASLENVSMTEITEAFNEGFSDYFFKFNATEKYLRDRWEAAGVSLTLSAGGWVNDRLVALLISGVGEWEDKLTSYNAGTCVAPAARGNHFTSRAYEFLVPRFQEQNIDQLLLEVIRENSRAIPVYERIGFSRSRILDCYAGQPKISHRKTPPDVDLEISNELDFALIADFRICHPAWESSLPALQVRLQRASSAWQVRHAHNLLAYAVVDDATGQIYSFGVHPDHRRQGLGSLLISRIGERHERLKINNVDHRDAVTAAFLEMCEIPKVIDQYEMKMML